MQLDEVEREPGDVGEAVAKRRDPELDDLESVHEVEPEASFFDQLRETRCVAATMRVSTFNPRSDPTGRISFVSTARVSGIALTLSVVCERG